MLRPRAFALAFAAAAFVSLVSSLTTSAPISAATFDSATQADALRAVDVPTTALVPSGQLIVSAQANGAWNIFATDPAGTTWQPISPSALSARDPAISPDGKSIAFRSNRDGFWDIYTLPSGSTVATRLTSGMVYSGAPVWSPDGKKIAFESYARGDLDIFTMNADGTQPLDLTNDSKSHDYGPAWSPNGKLIAFTSWRTGTQQIYVVAANCTVACKATNLSQNKFDDEEPAWSPDGKQIAFVSDRDGQRAIYLADYAELGLVNARRLTFSGWDDQPAWSPDGKWVAFVSARPTRQPIYIVPSTGGMPRIVANGPTVASSVAWSSVATVSSDNPPAAPDSSLVTEQPDLAPPGSGHPYEMRRMTSTRLNPGINKLNSLVANSFIALQTRVKQQVGYDFLSVMSDMTRPVDMLCDITCDTLSWHKSGRAWDSRLDYQDASGIGGLEVVREDQQGETFWRVFLRTAAQDGSMGEPMKEAPWDFSYNARWIVTRGQGGTKKPLPYGFYVDFTELAREYGWERISSHDSPDFDWKTDKIGAEYWHFQQTDWLNWYQGMREVYSENDLKAIGDWDSLARNAGYDPYLLYLKGIPEPPKAWLWHVLGP